MVRVERKVRQGGRGGDGPSKFLLFIHLDNFALRTMPGRRQTMNTLNLLQDQFPERLGRAILFCPPAIFAALISWVRPLMSKSTREKIIVVKGSCAPGTVNDATLGRIVGENWRALTGATMSQETPQSSPGYRHEAAWGMVQREEGEWNRSTGRLSSMRAGHVENPGAEGPAYAPGTDATLRRSSFDGAMEEFYDAEDADEEAF